MDRHRAIGEQGLTGGFAHRSPDAADGARLVQN
jgi:hypothetical protein